jgi:hypothetical protein
MPYEVCDPLAQWFWQACLADQIDANDNLVMPELDKYRIELKPKGKSIFYVTRCPFMIIPPWR